MPSEIKFNAFGVPYVVEFGNVSFKNFPSLTRKPPKSTKLLSRLPQRSVTLSHCPTCHKPKEVFKVQSLNFDLLETKPEDSHEQSGGLYIQLPSRRRGTSQEKISPEKLSRLRKTIAYAVTQAGMSTPAASDRADPLNAIMGGSESQPQTRTANASHTLFKGTYGQVKGALQDAGLVVTPCPETGYDYGKNC